MARKLLFSLCLSMALASSGLCQSDVKDESSSKLGNAKERDASMKFVAHRGYSAKYPENTLPAFEAALNHPECGRSLIGIEIDIRLTRDNAMAVFHDDKVLFDNVKVPVELISLDNLQEAAKKRFKGVPVPVLDQVFDLVQHRLELLVEMKDGAYDKQAFMDSLDASLARYNPKGDVILHSFSLTLMKMAVERFSGRGVRFGVLVGEFKELAKFPPELMEKIETIHPNWKFLAEHEDEFAAKGKRFNVWTVNAKNDLETMKNLKHADMISAIMTDDLALIEGR